MLAEKLSTNLAGTLGGGIPTQIPAISQFTGEFTPVANLTTRDINVSIGAQGDVAVQFTYTNCNWAWDLGYNFWGRSCEKFSKCSPCSTSDSCNSTSNCTTSCNSTPYCDTLPISPITANSWALKGDSSVVGFNGLNDACVPL